MAQAADTTKADQARRAKLDDQVAKAQADVVGPAADESDSDRVARIERDRRRVRDQHAAAAEAVDRQNRGECPVVVDDEDGPGTGSFCAGKLGHEGEHAA